MWQDANCPSCDEHYITLNGTVTKKYPPRLTAHKRNGQYELHIQHVSKSDSGKYTCVDNAGLSGAQFADAYLLAIAQTPVSSHHEIPTSGFGVTSAAVSPTTSSNWTTFWIGVAAFLILAVILFVILWKKRTIRSPSQHFGALYWYVKRPGRLQPDADPCSSLVSMAYEATYV
jgi:hypothetical protein